MLNSTICGFSPAMPCGGDTLQLLGAKFSVKEQIIVCFCMPHFSLNDEGVDMGFQIRSRFQHQSEIWHV